MLGTAGARLKEELRQLKLEGQWLHKQLLMTKNLLVNAGNQRESCRRQVEMLNRELEAAKTKAETKTMECVALGDKRECLSRELKNTEEDIRKLRGKVKTHQTSRKVRQKELEAINAQSLFSRPPNLYCCSSLRGKNHHNIETLPNVTFAVSSRQRWLGYLFKIILQAKNILEDSKESCYV